MDSSQVLAVKIYKTIAESGELDVSVVMAGLGVVMSTIITEIDMPEEKAVYAFRKSLAAAKRRAKAMASQPQVH
jgi:ABC-type Fe3+ transport system permease subunit